MTVSYTLTEGLRVGIDHLWPLAAVPVAVGLLAHLMFGGQHDERSASVRSRRLLFGIRTLVVGLLIVGAMGPYTVQTRETAGESRVTLLIDESASMGVYRNISSDLVSDIEDEDVPVTTATVGSGSDSRIGDGIVSNLRENGTVVVLSDGQVTAGRKLRTAAETANALNGTVSTVDIEPARVERAISLSGPSTASVGISTEFTVSLSGVKMNQPASVKVTIDGETVKTGQLTSTDTLTVTREFNETGTHRITARLIEQDLYAKNNVFYHSVRVVEKPDVLYVSQSEYPLRGYLSSLYDLTNASSVPDDLDDYRAVVVQDMPAANFGNITALQEYVIGGGGVVVVGGEDAYENGRYSESPVASMLPVQVGNATGGASNIVLLVDVTGSVKEKLALQKGIALDVLNQLGNENRVGVVAFDSQAYHVADIQPLESNRKAIADRIRRLTISDRRGGTDIANGLLGARALLGDRHGTVIMLSDGWGGDPGQARAVARQLGREDIRIITVGAARRVNRPRMSRIASASGGSYFPADERNRFRLLFGSGSGRFGGQNLTVVTPHTFITSGVTLSASPGKANKVSVKSGATYHVATGEGTPAIASWRFGLGRVVSLTSYGQDGSLDGLLSRPTSLVITKSVNYAIGNPADGKMDVTNIGDARVGQATKVTYRGEERPETDRLSLRQVSEHRYVGEFTPESAGFEELLGTTYAVNYAAEYGRFGTSPALRQLVEATGGRTFSPAQASTIARLAREQAMQVQTVKERWSWVAILLALVVFTMEVLGRRIQVYRGRTHLESGLR